MVTGLTVAIGLYVPSDVVSDTATSSATVVTTPEITLPSRCPRRSEAISPMRMAMTSSDANQMTWTTRPNRPSSKATTMIARYSRCRTDSRRSFDPCWPRSFEPCSSIESATEEAADRPGVADSRAVADLRAVVDRRGVRLAGAGAESAELGVRPVLGFAVADVALGLVGVAIMRPASESGASVPLGLLTRSKLSEPRFTRPTTVETVRQANTPASARVDGATCWCAGPEAYRATFRAAATLARIHAR